MALGVLEREMEPLKNRMGVDLVGTGDSGTGTFKEPDGSGSRSYTPRSGIEAGTFKEPDGSGSRSYTPRSGIEAGTF